MALLLIDENKSESFGCQRKSIVQRSLLLDGKVYQVQLFNCSAGKF